jgi:hypothetical protein
MPEEERHPMNTPGGNMPEVKPQWIDDRDLHSEDICDCPVGNKKLVLTLDKITAWLIVTQLPKLGNKADYLIGYGDCIRNLLAQVQAWKEGK